MNPTLVYKEVIRTTPSDTTEEQLAKAKTEMDNDLAWKQWNSLAQTQIFRSLLKEVQQDLLQKSMRNFHMNSMTSLVEANTIDKILNSVMINGKYETPS